jgi:hypothetical protein
MNANLLRCVMEVVARGCAGENRTATAPLSGEDQLRR